MTFWLRVLWAAAALFITITGIVTYEHGREGFGILLIVYGVILYFRMPME